ncbi:hypothetical protein K493DRAFT_302940 [Basidiobolus meristosporus CBS 931.73]|uniref:Family A G protein-coupled receptor-like protein n=1 Tax=Basidiobolus meristosporus CBS 931.73 TaxID=1314790 RepID=A0A1Y1Y524_9FUNG|nr:hypothetical protein K493DRAFT_302940 [Basidiobolus meristosporus CBS 931.73]|eukprot:ORX93049.1 hypothetical protein K493DRAFT_302940 [Basidiobolus meristosporus CBS 931.73]
MVSLAEVHTVLSTLSIASCLLVASVIIFIWYFNKEAVNRVSIRLTLAMLISDALFTTASRWAAYQSVPWVGTFCVWLYLFAFNSFCFLNIAIVLNLYLIFVRGTRNAVNLERIYFISVFCVAFTLATLPAAFGVIGLDFEAHTCWFINQTSKSSRIWQLMTYVLPSLACVLFCTLTLVLILIHLFRQKLYFKRNAYEPDVERTNRVRKQQRMINFMVARIVLYPIVIVLVRFPIVIVIHYVYVQKANPPPAWTSQLTQTCDVSQGLLNSLVFCLDPALHSAWHSFRQNMTRRYTMSTCFDKSFTATWRRRVLKIFAYEVSDESSTYDSFRYSEGKSEDVEGEEEIKRLL